ncbi:hypothetical protein IMZ48_08155 [Candidatus Bathyarchaeota archaeon]|nr:hypothetical protein [Candidatus Bathyarchaeota archaeon]
MATATEITRLAERQVEEAGEMLGRAFFDNPMALYLFPDERSRARPLAWMFATFTRYCHLHGEVHTTSGRIDGSAAWLRPDSPAMSRETIAAAGIIACPVRGSANADTDGVLGTPPGQVSPKVGRAGWPTLR